MTSKEALDLAIRNLDCFESDYITDEDDTHGRFQNYCTYCGWDSENPEDFENAGSSERGHHPDCSYVAMITELLKLKESLP